jgi:paraquat-inducible protein B
MTEATRSLKRLTDSLDRQPESLLRGRKEQTR